MPRHLAWCMHGRRVGCCGNSRIICSEGAKPRRVTRKQCGPKCPRAALPGIPAKAVPIPSEPPLLVAVITSRNEGKQIRQTVDSLLDSTTAATHVVVIDDGGTDGSCDFMLDRVTVVRHEESQGVGRSRNAGYAIAKKMGAQVVSFHDAHMRFPKGGMGILAKRALSAGTFVCAGSHGLSAGSQRLWGCDMFYGRRDGVQPLWLHMKPPEKEWVSSRCPMGAGYVLGMETASELEDATGQLWDDTAGIWGFSEQAIGIKCFLLNIGIEFSRDVLIRHRYGQSDYVPTANIGQGNWRNVTYCTALYWGRALWHERWAGHCGKRLPASEVKEYTELAWKHEPLIKDIETSDRVFQWAFGKRAPGCQLHPDHAWLPDLQKALAEIAEAHPDGEGVDVLQWRPGESTVLVRRALPEAKICVIALPGQRTDNWFDWAKRMGVRMHSAPYKGYVESATTAFKGRFDLVLVNGELQKECTAKGEDKLKPGGVLLTNPAGDRLQIEDAERRECDKKLKVFLKQPQVAPPEPQAKGAANPKAAIAAKPQTIELLTFPETGLSRQKVRNPAAVVTVCLLNYQRPQNIGRLLDCLNNQTVPLQVFLWGNSPLTFISPETEQETLISEHPIVRLMALSSENLGCFPRWWLAAQAETEYVCSMDDDLLFRDSSVLEDAITAHKEECPEGIVGFFGASEVPGKPYKQWRHHNGTTTGCRADIVKGRFMLTRREHLARVPLAVPALDGLYPTLVMREDDIILSMFIGGGKAGAHVIPARLGKRWKELPQHHKSASSGGGHYQRRDRTFRILKELLAGGE